MRRMTRVPMTLALSCLLVSSAIAADEMSGQTPKLATRDFTLNFFDPGNSGQAASNSPATTTPSQGTTQPAPGTASQAPGALPRVSTVQPTPLSTGEKWHYYLRNTFGPRSFVFTALGTGISQAQGSTPEWGGGMEGYGKRYGSSFGQKIVDQTVRVSMQSLFHEDPRYRPSGKSGILSRSVYAASQEFIAHKDDGGTRPNFSRWIGAFSAAYVSRQWHPDSYHTTSDYLTAGAQSIGISAAKNLWSEFWPDIKRWLHH